MHEAIGTVVKYVDEVSVAHDALITEVHGPELGVNSINLVYVVSDENKTDPYGRQIERASSVSPEGPNTAYGRFYRVVHRVG